MDYQKWIQEIKELCQPKSVHICDGSDEEYRKIAQSLVDADVFVPLKNRPNSFWCHSHPDDVARVEERTFICSLKKEDAGPTNNWRDPKSMHHTLKELFSGCMKGRVMYVIPYLMGPVLSKYAKVGFEITDSPYAVLNMKLMTRMGKVALDQYDGTFVPGVHSVGRPLKEGEKDVPWPCNPDHRYIVHFPEERSIWSFGSGYGGNALLGKKCFALRIASVMARDEGWMAEHMLILGLTSPEGKKRYMTAAFPSACGKTNLAMLIPSLPGWKVECVGDDIAWMHVGSDGQLYAINPEAGYFGVAPGTSMKTNPNAIKALTHDSIFTNVALTEDRDVWWEGLTPTPPPNLTSWLGTKWDPSTQKPAAHPNSRFTVSQTQCPIYDPEAQNPEGVPISAIIFGGRRNATIPLVREANSWQQGVFFGASISSEMTAAAKGTVGQLRHDPFAMLPFCGYHMGEYFQHWLDMGKKLKNPPKIYCVNWFKKAKDGSFLWPGFGENSRVLKWIFERVENKASATPSAIGALPKNLDMGDLKVDLEELLSIDTIAWQKEVEELRSYFALFEKKLPKEMLDELGSLEKGLS